MTTKVLDPRTVDPEATYYVANKSRSIVIFHDSRTHIESGEFYKFEGRDDPSGRHILDVPGAVLKQRKFMEAIARGLLELRSEEDFYATAGALAPVAEFDDEILASIDRSAVDGITTTECIGPRPKGSNQPHCGVLVSQRSSEATTKPPLCDLHEGFAHYFTYDPSEGWQRIKG